MEIKDQRSKLSFEELIERCGNAKVLVVDDKQENIQVVGTLLKSLNWIRLYVALSGQKALEATMEYRPDLILLDLNMVDMDGLETLRRLRDLGALEFATVIFLTADQAKENRLEGLSLGCADYIQKPFDQEEFLIKVAYHIKMRLYEKVLLKNLGDTAALLNNIKQAIFCTNENGLIMAPVSDHSQAIFGEDPTGKSIYDLVFSKASLSKDELEVLRKNFSEVYKSSKVNWIIESAKFPDKVNVQAFDEEEKILKIVYTPLWNNEILESIMMTFEDITEKERFSKKKNQYNLQQIAQIVDLKVETLRTWTKRYGLKGEFKDSKGEYRFSGEDLERFKTYKILIDKGEKIGHLVRLNDAELKGREAILKEKGVKGASIDINNSNSTEVLNSLFYFLETKNLDLFMREFSKIGELFEKRDLVLNIVAPLLSKMISSRTWEKLILDDANFLKHFFSKKLNEFNLQGKKPSRETIKGPLLADIFPSFNSIGRPLALLLSTHFSFESTSVEGPLIDTDVCGLIRKVQPPFIVLNLERKGGNDEREFTVWKEEIFKSNVLKKQNFVVLNNHSIIQTKNILDNRLKFCSSFEELETFYNDYLNSTKNNYKKAG